MSESPVLSSKGKSISSMKSVSNWNALHRWALSYLQKGSAFVMARISESLLRELDVLMTAQ